MADLDLTAEQRATLAAQIEAIGPLDCPPDAMVPNLCAILNDPTGGPAIAPTLRPVDLPALIGEGLLTSAQIEAIKADPLAIDFFRQLVHAHPHGATRLSPESMGLIQAARVAMVLDAAQALAIAARFDPITVREADVAAGTPDARTELAPTSWAIAALGRPVAGADIEPILEELNNGNAA